MPKRPLLPYTTLFRSCGAALGVTVREAYESAYRTDPTSAFGGIIAFNRELDASAAEAILERQFVEVLAAPAVSTRSEEHTSELQSLRHLVCRLLLEKK